MKEGAVPTRLRLMALELVTGGGLPEPVPATVSVKGRLNIAVTSAALVGLNTISKEKLLPGVRVKGKVPEITAVNSLEPKTSVLSAGIVILPLPE